MMRNKAFSLINVAGLSLGLVCSILIALWVRDEYRMDAFHDNIERIYSVTSVEYSGENVTVGYGTPGLLADELKRVMPEIQYACKVTGNSWHALVVGDRTMKVGGAQTGKDFFKMFSYPLLAGTRDDALGDRESIAISRKVATNLFGSPEQALGKSLLLDDSRDYKVTAVFEDMDEHVSVHMEYLRGWNDMSDLTWMNSWHNNGPATYVMLTDRANAVTLSTKIREFIKSYDKDYSKDEHTELGLQPFTDRYLRANFPDGHFAGGRILYIRIFTFVGIFVLLIACINFMNLSTARSMNRAREIGVRKVSGAVRPSLIGQFMSEAFLFTLLSVLLSLVLLLLLLPQFNLLTGKNIPLPFSEASFWVELAILVLLTGLISGSYPAFLLSSFKPTHVLNSNSGTMTSSGAFRRGLVVFQFGLSMIFIVAVMIIARQVDFVQDTNLGYQKSNLIYLPLEGYTASHFDAFKHEALQVPGVLEVTAMTHRPVEMENGTSAVRWEGMAPGSRVNFSEVGVEYDFVQTFGATILHGRDFSPEYADSSNYIINEAAWRVINYDDPVGMPLTFQGTKGTIIGVVKDFHFNSLYVSIEPLVIRLEQGGRRGTGLVRLDPMKKQSALAGIGVLLGKLNPNFPVAIQFADEEYAYSYQHEQVVERLSGYSMILAVLITCLGLLGLVMYTAERRIREIGIRKVLGATVSQVTLLLTRDFVRLVALSAIISVPVSYYVMNKWLDGFAYHISIRWWMFLLAGVGGIMVALLTVGYKAIKAAMANPVESLRAE